MRNRIEAAIIASGDYWQKCLSQRNPGPDSAGSVFDVAQTTESILAACENVKPADDPAIKAPAVGFVVPLSGRMGIVAIDSLSDDTEVTLRDRKGTGQVDAEMPGERGKDVDFTTILIGPNERAEIVWTLFPGPSIAPSEVPAENRDGDVVTIAEAKALGLSSVKLTG